MKMRVFGHCGFAGALLLALTGCGNYTITFELDDVINGYTGADIPNEPLPVDIVVMTKDETERYPEIVEGRMGADEWFHARTDELTKISGISPDHIFALRDGGPAPQRDRRVRETLLSPRNGGPRTVQIKIKHPQAGSSKAALVIYAGFKDETGRGYRKTPPIVIQPPPAGKKEIVIDVSKRSWAKRAVR